MGEMAGRTPAGASLLAWVRCRAEFYLPATLSSFVFVRFLALFLFPSFPELYRTSSYSDFRVYLSGLHKMPLVCVNLRHDLICITMPLVCVNPCHDLVCKNALGLRESSSRLGLHTMPLICLCLLS